MRAALEHQEIARGGAGERLAAEARLADARLAADERDAPLAGGHLGEALIEPAELLRAAHEGSGRRHQALEHIRASVRRRARDPVRLSSRLPAAGPTCAGGRMNPMVRLQVAVRRLLWRDSLL